MNRYKKINKIDNVAVALEDINPGETVTIEDVSFEIREKIPRGHKFALKDLEEGSNVIKYGFPIGHTLKPVSRGELIDHTNLKTNLEGVVDYDKISPLRDIKDEKSRGEISTFKGYLRENGDAGIRNELWVIPTVGCVNGIAHTIVDRFKAGLRNMEVDGIYAFHHPYGCSQLGEDHENTRLILRDMVKHPNAGGILVIGLGCENNQPAEFAKLCGDFNPERVKFMVCQEIEGDEIEEGLKILDTLYHTAKGDKRTDVPMSKLKVGLKCGGSDGLSGITANPLLGLFTDYLCNEENGAAVLTEVPEMFGAETLLMQRSKDQKVLDRIIEMVNGFKEYFLSHGEPVGENPSPGNKTGGISTLEEKSLGCVQKAGSVPVVDVLKYGERISKTGLTLLTAPGNDLVAATALGAAGCQLILFTTGKGTPFCTFVPTIKVSTNTPLYEKKKNWIDFNAGGIVEGETFEQVLADFIRYVKSVADGRHLYSEDHLMHEIAIFKSGVTL